MIEVFIFFLHILAALYAFTRAWQEDHVKEGLLAIGLIGLVFAIGWSITGTVAHLIMPGGTGVYWFTADTLSLVLLFIPEAILFRVFFLQREYGRAA